MATKDSLSVEYIRQALEVRSGRLFWRSRPNSHFSCDRSRDSWNTRYSGTEAGCINRNINRWSVRINGIRIYRYQVIWMMRHGSWPPLLDHKNRNRLDDRIGNLRIATQRENLGNSTLKPSNTSGYKGVSWDQSRDKWLAQIRNHGRRVFLGRFDTATDAHDAYVTAAKKVFGDFACAG